MIEIIIFENENITCPECSEIIATVIRPIYSQDAIGAEHFEFLIDCDEEGECPSCNADWLTLSDDKQQITRIHTERGWIPGYGMKERPRNHPLH